MAKITVEYAQEVAAQSEAAILSHGGEVLAVLPYLDRSGLRTQTELVGRALVMNALIDLNFNTSVDIVRNWIAKHDLTQYLTAKESAMLARRTKRISQEEKNNLAWSLDALWALMWAGSLLETMDFASPIPNSMYELCPHVKEGEGPEKFADRMKIRSFDEIYRTLDLYYRLHWYSFQYQLRDELGVFDLSRFIERRRALEWLVSPHWQWDEVPLNT